MTADGFPRIVLLYGTGLIGASFGLALKQRISGIRVYGIDSPEVLARAQGLGAIDEGTLSADDPDLIILAAPVGTILDLLDGLPPATPSVIVDVGSTKVEICRKAANRGLQFVGGHPMTGSEKSGPDAASADLFRGAPFFLCPVSTAPQNALAGVMRLVEAVGAKPVVMSAEEHDRVVAQLSHLPQVLSTLLADQTAERYALAGPGWKSLTRLAASPFHVWRDILLTSGSLPLELRLFTDRLCAVLDALESGNMKEIERMFERANRVVPEEGTPENS
jgi:prephenate dehydrogenase